MSSKPIKLPDSPEDFLKMIPAQAAENLRFRQRLHTILADSKPLQRVFLDLCRAKPQIAFKTMLWTFQPKREQSLHKHLPFITWPVQDECIDVIVRKIREGGDLIVDKSREMGATWIMLGCFFIEWLLNPDSTFLITSRKEEYVWKKGNPDTLFWKLEYMLKNLPNWVVPRYATSERHLENLDNGSVIDGESTNADVGAGGRRQAVLCDEFARVPPNDAQMIQETLSDTTPCRIFNSTPTTRSHPFGQLRFSGNIDVITLAWWRHPYKIQGWYESPQMDIIVIKDIDYYRARWPEVFNHIEPNTPIKYSDLEKQLLCSATDEHRYADLRFIANGNDKADRKYWSPTGRRSIWYDRECDRRTPRDKAINIDMDYIGAGDTVINPMTLMRQTEEFGRPPTVCGEIEYFYRQNKLASFRFYPNFGRRRLQWWGELAGGRPPQTHNYVVGCDISLGAGYSNSVASVFDCNLNMKVGRWSCPNTSPTMFAEVVVALCHWVGGASTVPFLIWENNGCGQVFGRRVIELNYPLVYRARRENTRAMQKTEQVGWHNTRESLTNLLIEYEAALEAAFNKSAAVTFPFVNPDKQALHEAEEYVFYENGGVGPASCQEDEGGAKAAHGDMVIADALCCLARKEQPRAAAHYTQNEGLITLAYRRQIAAQRKENDEASVWLVN